MNLLACREGLKLWQQVACSLLMSNYRLVPTGLARAMLCCTGTAAMSCELRSQASASQVASKLLLTAKRMPAAQHVTSLDLLHSGCSGDDCTFDHSLPILSRGRGGMFPDVAIPYMLQTSHAS